MKLRDFLFMSDSLDNELSIYCKGKKVYEGDINDFLKNENIDGDIITWFSYKGYYEPAISFEIT